MVGAGLLTGTGMLGGAGYAGYKYCNAGTATTGTPENSLQPGSPYTTPETGGSLEDTVGHHTLYHDDPVNKPRHLPASAYNTTEPKLDDDALRTTYSWINSIPANLQWKDNSDEDLSEIYYDLDSENGSGENQSEYDYILDLAMPEL